MPEVADAADEFYLWDTDVSDGTEPKLIARKTKGGSLEILDAKAYFYGDFPPAGQSIDLSKPDFKINPRKVGAHTYPGRIIEAYEGGESVADIAKRTKTTERAVFDNIVKHEIDPTITAPVPQNRPENNNRAARTRGNRTYDSTYDDSVTSESLSDAEAQQLFSTLSSRDAEILRNYVAKKPGAFSLYQMSKKVPLDLVIWASKQKPEVLQESWKSEHFEKLQALPPFKRDRLLEMIQDGESMGDIASELNLGLRTVYVAQEFVDEYGYIPSPGDTGQKSDIFASVSINRKARLFGKATKTSMLNGVVKNEQ